MASNLTGKSSSPLLKYALIGASLIGTIGLAGFGVSRFLREGATDVVDPSAPTQDDFPAGFAMGSLSATEPIEKIRITIEAEPGAAINEIIDLHLGFGFPLRLSPSTTSEAGPVFAALPSGSSLGTDVNAIPAGQLVWFQFDPSDKSSDRDPLQTSHTLLSGLTVGDISQIGFASRGVADWTLAKYKIELNDKLYAANGSFKQSLKQAREQYQFEVTEMLARNDSLGSEVRELKTIVDAGLGSEMDEQSLAAKERELAGFVEPLRRMGGQLLGQFPSVVETEGGFQPLVASDRVSSIRVEMLAGGVERPGTLNPLYLRAGGRKFLLSSELAPLNDAPNEQVFELTPVDLGFDPVSRNDIKNFSIGLLGSNQPLDQIPDSAKLQRVSLEVDGESVYDSEPIQSDRQSLERVILVPPAHRDERGQVVVNPSDDFERYAWMPGLKIPQTRPIKSQNGLGKIPAESTRQSGPDTAVATTTSTGSSPGGKIPGGKSSGVGPSDPSESVVGASGSTSVPGKTNGSDGPNVAAGSGPDSDPGTSDIDSGLGSDGGDPGANLANAGGSDSGSGNSGPGSRGPGITGPPDSGFGSGGPSLSGGSFPPGPGFSGAGPGSSGPGPGSSGPGSSGPGSAMNPPTRSFINTANPNDPVNIETLIDDLIAALANRPGSSTPSNPAGPGNVPGGANPNTANPTVIPAPKKLQISFVGFGGVSVPADGSPCTVNWEVENSQEVKEFQVRLWARLPHRGSQVPILIGESERVPNLLASGSGVFRSAPVPAIDLASTLLSASEHHRAMVEPEVIAFDSDGNMISQGGAAKGPMLPLLTKDSQLNQQRFVIGRDPSIQLRRQSSVQAQFQIDGDGFDAPVSTIPWNPFASKPTYDGKSAWINFAPTNSHNALTFGASTVSPVVSVSAWDPNVGQLTVRFDNQVKLDSNYRLVAHLGIMNGNATTDNQVQIDARLIVQDISGNKGGIYEPDDLAGTASAAEVLRIATTRTVTYDKQGARTPMFLIDIPIARDLGYAAYNTELFETASIGMSTLTDMEVDQSFEQRLPMGSIDKAMVSLTLMLKMSNRIDNEAIGLFGLRLVKDPDQRSLPQGASLGPIVNPHSQTAPPTKEFIAGRWVRVTPTSRTVYTFRADGTYSYQFDFDDGSPTIAEDGSWTLDRHMMSLTPTNTTDPFSVEGETKETSARSDDAETLEIGIAGLLKRNDPPKELPPIPMDVNLLYGTWVYKSTSGEWRPDGSIVSQKDTISLTLDTNGTFTQKLDFERSISGTADANSITAGSTTGSTSTNTGTWGLNERILIQKWDATSSTPASTTERIIERLDKNLLDLSGQAGKFQKSFSAPIKTSGPKQPITSNAGSAPPTNPGSSSGGTLTPEQQAFVKAHNDARAAVNVAPLQWSATLAADAQGWADELARLDKVLTQESHRSFSPNPTSIDQRKYGENLHGGRKASFQTATKGWIDDEKPIYLNRTPGKTGHYTQAVWADTKFVGGAIATSKSGRKYVVGVYDPPGNFIGQKPYPAASGSIPAGP
ncbi:Cysteine-rich secretory protein family protein [Rubripirellula tenax]|uniref:Cysteine-rich secretory protein family protein n=1 Tax=Rubripirellula tenax TaxID=2528015 RepID=A0A5C6EPX1_9BACT|nr:CAP domain-containing protein [Rubripirellula tenax]TWU50665.1 Cysteine-rich secretory protein family protein [Rubripirellula tenax]